MERATRPPVIASNKTSRKRDFISYDVQYTTYISSETVSGVLFHINRLEWQDVHLLFLPTSPHQTFFGQIISFLTLQDNQIPFILLSELGTWQKRFLDHAPLVVLSPSQMRHVSTSYSYKYLP
jgi:hypothetical protein